ncbi:MAG: hypothetical protein M1840_007523 [Geoglossum simile]|nr:MAG: hypothetical protein M1840_007523 [Geoglossum simile]
MAQPLNNAQANIHIIKQRPLKSIDIVCLVINKMIGTGIFVTPPLVLSLVGTNIYIYLEYGLAWPFNGGEYTYVSKIFPRPTLVFACSYAWFFVCFSTSTGNAINFARFVCFSGSTNNPYPSEWKLKFIACGIVVAVGTIHYRLVNLGIWANIGLATYKVLLLSILILSGMLGGLIRESREESGIPGTHDFGRKGEKSVTASTFVTAILLVLYSYSGWENGNYVTAEIDGDDNQKRRTLKKGVLWGVSIVSAIYILFNLMLFLLLSYEELKEATTTVAYEYILHAFGRGGIEAAASVLYVCIALSALGNLVGVIFTSGRGKYQRFLSVALRSVPDKMSEVKRDIASHRLIPGWRFFEASSHYGRNRDGLGTPTGGLILHTLVSCIVIASTPMFDRSLEGFTFVTTLFQYGHAVLGGRVTCIEYAPSTPVLIDVPSCAWGWDFPSEETYGTISDQRLRPAG